VEAYALWEGIKIVKEGGISKLLILCDSMLVPRAIIKGFEVNNNLLDNISVHPISLLFEFEDLSILLSN